MTREASTSTSIAGSVEPADQWRGAISWLTHHLPALGITNLETLEALGGGDNKDFGPP
jgi:hypothetical protein